MLPIACSKEASKAYIFTSPSILTINLIGQVRDLDRKHLIVDLTRNAMPYTFDHTIGQGQFNFSELEKNKCVQITERFNFKPSNNKEQNLKINNLRV